MLLWCNSHPPDHLYSALLKETNLLSEPLLGQEEKLCRWSQHTLQEDTCSSPSSHQHLNSNYIKFCYLLNTKQEGKPFPTIWHVVNSNFIHDSCAFRTKQVRPWPFHSRLCSVYLRAFNLLNGGFPIPYIHLLSDILVSHSHNTAKAPDHNTVHGPTLNKTHFPAFTAQIFSVSTGRPRDFFKNFILLKIKQRKTLQNTTSNKVVPRGALISFSTNCCFQFNSDCIMPGEKPGGFRTAVQTSIPLPPPFLFFKLMVW